MKPRGIARAHSKGWVVRYPPLSHLRIIFGYNGFFATTFSVPDALISEAHERLLTRGFTILITSERPDAELVAAARQGDVGSFGELYRRHYAAAVGIAYSALSDRHLAEDAAQETFAFACRDWTTSATTIRHWIGAICRKVAPAGEVENRVTACRKTAVAAARIGDAPRARIAPAWCAVRATAVQNGQRGDCVALLQRPVP